MNYIVAMLLLAPLVIPAFAGDGKNRNRTATSKNSSVMEGYTRILAAARKTPPALGSIICIGSSHMERWKSIKTDLAPLTVHNYGVGGSRMSDAADLFIEDLAIAFKPRAVILYEGSNDIASESTPEEVLANFQALYGKLHKALPETRLYVISVVPSPGKRFKKIDVIRKTNELLRKECNTQDWMQFMNITRPLISEDGKPKPECFIPGDIHMTAEGYAVWKSVITPVIVTAEKPFEAKQN